MISSQIHKRVKYCASHFALRTNTELNDIIEFGIEYGFLTHSIGWRLIVHIKREKVITTQKIKMASLQSNVIQQQFRFSVPVNNLDKFNTPEIHINEVPWMIKICKAKIENRDVINISLVCCYKSTENEKWSIEAGAKIKLVSFEKDQYSIEKTIPISNFDADENVVDIGDFVTGEDLFNDEKKFIKHQALRFDALITTSPQKKQIESLFFDVTSAKFGVMIRDIKKLDHLSSKKFKLCGIEWFVKFEKIDNYLAVFLHHGFKEDDFVWSFNVNFTAKLMPIREDFESSELSCKRRFNAGIANWGWSKFIEWEKLLDSKNGYCTYTGYIFFEISIDVEPCQPFWKTEIGLLKNVSSSSKIECPICLNMFADQEVVTTLCGHLYCHGCVKTAIANKPHCPMCNAIAAPGDLRVVHLRT